MTSHLVPHDDLGWQDAEVGRARTSVCSAIAWQAVARPDRPAVVGADGRVLTYGALEERSGRLAARLVADGVGPGSCVALFLERSPEFVAAAYAVMRAGAAYLPLDVATPGDRIEFVLSDAGARIVLTDGRELPAGSWRAVRVDEPAAVPAAPPVLAEPAPESLAYVIYTSGSTGRPRASS